MRLSDKLREYLQGAQGRVVNLRDIRSELKIDPTSPEWESCGREMRRLVAEKIVRPSGRNDGIYKVVTQVQPVRVFADGRERRPIFDLRWPEDRERGMPLEFTEHVVIREGDLITVGGVKSRGKTTLCINLAAENVDKKPILMGNEYTIFTKGIYEPAPRFFNRLALMREWVEWTDGDGSDKFVLLPVKEDYAEHIVEDRINIIDWINLDGNQLYDISKVLGDIKSALGRGIAIVALQKGEGAVNPRGGQFVRDFSDVEILLDGFGDTEDDVLLTIKGCKEKTAPIVGRSYAFTITREGTEIWNFREVKKCPTCRGSGYVKGGTCDDCYGNKFVDK